MTKNNYITWPKDLNIRQDTIKLRTQVQTFSDINRTIFLGQSHNQKKKKKKKKKQMGPNQTFKICTTKEINKTKRKPMD